MEHGATLSTCKYLHLNWQFCRSFRGDALYTSKMLRGRFLFSCDGSAGWGVGSLQLDGKDAEGVEGKCMRGEEWVIETCNCKCKRCEAVQRGGEWRDGGDGEGVFLLIGMCSSTLGALFNRQTVSWVPKTYRGQGGFEGTRQDKFCCCHAREHDHCY